jgi:hypothetical protein
MFTPEERTRLRSDLLAYAANDGRITGAAITGSAAAAHEDVWSDIDLAFGVGDAAKLQSVLSDWTAHMYGQHGAIHHFDVNAGAWTYRVFLLGSTLQVDLAFVSAAEFRPLAPTFQLVFGQAGEERPFPSPQITDLIGLGWLYALHARSCIARRRLWQAEYMVSALRNQTLALACIRHGLPSVHGRGMDLLPVDVAAQFETSLVRRLDGAELARAFQAVTANFLSEIRYADPELGTRLQSVLIELSKNPIPDLGGLVSRH